MKSLVSVFLLSLFSTLAQASDILRYSEAKIRETPPGAMATAAFMQLQNPSSADVVISSASSPGFGRIELHLSKLEDGVAKMIPQENFTVPAQGEFALKPGGAHLMLFEATDTWKAGDALELTLHTNQGDVTVSAVITSMKHQMKMSHN